MSTYSWSVPTASVITGLTYIKDTDNKIQATFDDLADFVNGTGVHAGQGLTYDFVDKATAQTITGVKTFNGGIISNVTGNVTGNSDTATTLATTRNITLNGDVSGTITFNGSADANITTTVADDSHNHIISNVDGLQTALDSKQAVGNYVTTTSSQSLHSTDALRISGNTISLYKGNGTSESITIPNNGLGKSQSWGTYSRSLGTTYTNTTGQPIMVSVLMSGYYGDAILYVGTVPVARTYSSDNNRPSHESLTTVVPDGNTYKVLTTGTWSISYWSELR